MNPTTPTRRQLLLATAAATALPLGSAWAQSERRFAPEVGAWRRFALNTTVTLPVSKGPTRLWLPLPDVDTDYQRSVDNSWTSNATRVSVVADPSKSVRMLKAEFEAAGVAPELQLTSVLETRNRAVDWSRPKAVSEDPEVLKFNLAPTALLPLDGVVRSTAQQATKGAKTDLDKVRAIYGWVLANAHREPKTRGCGMGDIKGMLETGNLGGKCADLNAIFVGLCRASGVPARDVYGLRLAPSAFGYRELGGNSANLKGAQHCRAEVFLRDYGWVAMDPADVLKVMRQETPDWIKTTDHPLVNPVAKGLFGAWEGNWAAYNTAHDISLPGSSRTGTLPFLMYPQADNAEGRLDDLAPDTFRYAINAVERSA